MKTFQLKFIKYHSISTAIKLKLVNLLDKNLQLKINIILCMIFNAHHVTSTNKLSLCPLSPASKNKANTQNYS